MFIIVSSFQLHGGWCSVHGASETPDDVFDSKIPESFLKQANYDPLVFLYMHLLLSTAAVNHRKLEAFLHS